MAKGNADANDRFKFKQNPRTKEWRWVHYSGNNRTIGAATEGYKNRADCEKNAKRNGWDGRS